MCVLAFATLCSLAINSLSSSVVSLSGLVADCVCCALSLWHVSLLVYACLLSLLIMLILAMYGSTFVLHLQIYVCTSAPVA